MTLDLKGKQLEVLCHALLSAFTGYPGLQKMALFEMDVNLPDIVAPGPLSEVVLNLVLWARAEGRLEELVVGALNQVPRNQKLRQVAVELSLTSDDPPQDRLEALVLRNVPFQHVAPWRERMSTSERCVCRVEYPAGTGVGTGFLVGPDTVLTNWHVARLVTAPESAAVRFDFMADSQGVAVGAGDAYVLADEWLIDKSEEKDLDYALLRLAGSPGDEPVSAGDKSSRGWLEPRPYEFRIGEILLILQHPLSDPLKLSVGTMTAINNLHNRITYTANTQRGSSGSPVFTLGWELVALHHYGQQSGNLGIPLGPIWARLKSAGKLEKKA